MTLFISLLSAFLGFIVGFLRGWYMHGTMEKKVCHPEDHPEANEGNFSENLK
jgi:ABC-type antimicrobial peptide transport system permease subunit